MLGPPWGRAPAVGAGQQRVRACSLKCSIPSPPPPPTSCGRAVCHPAAAMGEAPATALRWEYRAELCLRVCLAGPSQVPQVAPGARLVSLLTLGGPLAAAVPILSR